MKKQLLLNGLMLLCFLGIVQGVYAQKINLKYLGAAGWVINDGETTILIDPYLTRLKLGNGPSTSKADVRKSYTDSDYFTSDTITINKIIDKADYILVHHSHFDHLADVPYIAKKTGAKVIATETSCKILSAYGIPDEQMIRVKGGEDYQFEKFSIRVIPSIHSALGDKHYFDSRKYTEEPKTPLKIGDFIEGGSLMFLLRFNEKKIMTMGSMNFVEREIEGIHADILLAGVNFSRNEIYKYTERLLKATGFPEIVIPTHWDNFRVPYGFSKSQQTAVEKKIKPFIEEVKAASPKSKVITPVHLETFTIK